MTAQLIRIREWQVADPDSEPTLRGLSFGADEQARRLSRQLSESNRIEVTELRDGLRIASQAYVGTVRLGPITIVVRPKLENAPLMTLMRYAYGLGDITLFSPAEITTAPLGFQDLFIHQLWGEVARLVARGLHRDYKATPGELSSPRGRIAFGSYARTTASGGATLPVTYHPRLADSELNRVILEGLHTAARAAFDIELRTKVRRLAALISEDVQATSLSRAAIRDARRKMDRRHANYEPALTIIELLFDATGIDLEDGDHTIQLAGFLFDMNRFFQSLLSRFLRENLLPLTVRDEAALKELFAYDPAHNPRARHAPTPRPDFVVMDGNQSLAVLDAKYRDLWERPLPRDMLYQLSLYALAQKADRKAAILYPTLSSAAEQRILFKEPIYGQTSATIVLRPVNLVDLASLVGAQHNGSKMERTGFARFLAFGSS